MSKIQRVGGAVKRRATTLLNDVKKAGAGESSNGAASNGASANGASRHTKSNEAPAGRKPLTRNQKTYARRNEGRKLEVSWQQFLQTREPITRAEYAETMPVNDIEEIVPCLLCGSETFMPLFSPAKKDWEYHVVQCTDCGLVFRNPNIIPEHLHKLYDSVNYNNFLSGNYGRDRQRKYRSVLSSFDDLFPKKGIRDGRRMKVLDFGCGNGLALEVLQKRDYETYGIDLSPESVDAAKELLGHDRVWCGEPLDFPEIANERFDFITMWSVLAHLPRPIDTLSELRSLLKPNGALLVFTVNANSLLMKRDHQKWNGYTRNHLAFYSPDTANELFKRCGFGEVYHRPHFANHFAGLQNKLSEREWDNTRTNVLEHRGGNMNRMLAFNRPD